MAKNTHLLELMLVTVGVHLEAVCSVDLLDEGWHAELPELLELVLFAEGNQLLGHVVHTHAVRVQILDQRPDSRRRGVQGDPANSEKGSGQTTE